ncbi:MAG: ribosome biogenesis factor YjgA [Candidatus Competibacter sp.]|nr:ribosome biogenesis factor YjgA [Candidatus Competibacter sp.]MDG4583335.1 ribosome biogenesis factor YjgA [Candidatus Competibacter sp.]
MRDDDREEDPHDPESPRPPSKSQRKRDATALQDLGEHLVKLTPTQLRRVPLSEDLLAAVRTAQAIPQRGARKRQLQWIGKLMRRLDDLETSAIRAALATVQHRTART